MILIHQGHRQMENGQYCKSASRGKNYPFNKISGKDQTSNCFKSKSSIKPLKSWTINTCKQKRDTASDC